MAGCLARAARCARAQPIPKAGLRLQRRFGVLPEAYDYATRRAAWVTNSPLTHRRRLHALWLIDRAPRWRAIGADHYAAMKR